MFRINAMELVGLEEREGLVLSWLPDGLLLEMSKSKVRTWRYLNPTSFPLCLWHYILVDLVKPESRLFSQLKLQ